MARVVLALRGCSSLKAKRSVVRRVLDRARNRFEVAAAEVADQDDHRRATLGFAVVSSDGRHVSSMLDKLLDYIDTVSEAPVVHRETELVHYGTGLADGDRWPGLGSSADGGDDDEPW